VNVFLWHVHGSWTTSFVQGSHDYLVPVTPAAGVVSNRVDTLIAALRWLAAEPDRARQMGCAAREHALVRYGLDRFLRDWDEVLEDVAR